MEAVEAFLDGEWDSLSKLFSFEDSDSLLHCNTNNFLVDANLCSDLDHHAGFHSVSLERSSAEIDMSLFASNGPSFPDDLMEEILHLKAQMLCNDEMDNADAEQHQNSSKKRPRVARQAKAKKARRRAKASKNEEEGSVGVVVGQSSSICSSEGDDCNGTGSEESESKGSTSTATAKNKASKSPATDPQSLYARKRRERINERLRILQNLVPNGTKVDISTMLEEAVQYVKFLQLQIKLLSSDDMWMYAPIAYNGMDMGLYQRINAPNL